MTLVIPQNLRSQTDIREVMERYVQNQPADRRWNDIYAGGAGQIVIDLLAAVASFDAFNEASVTRERSLSLAQLDSSIRELVFNKGIIEGPTGTLVLEFDVRPIGGARVVIGTADLIGHLGDYPIYALEDFDSTVPFTVRAAVGFLETQDIVTGNKPFTRWTFPLERRYVAPYLERLTIDDTTEVKMRSDPGDLSERGTDFVLRQVIPGRVTMFTGNGVLGWSNANSLKATYRYLNYDTDLASVLEEVPSFQVEGALATAARIVEKPVYGVSGDELRGLALFYPIDGRIVQDRDYSGVILKYFGGVLYDVYSYNEDPAQAVRLLVSPEFDEAYHLDKIRELVDDKRGPGIPVTYTVQRPGAGVVINLEFEVVRSDYKRYLDLRQDVSEWFSKRIRRYITQEQVDQRENVIDSDRIAVQLTNAFGFRVYSRSDVRVTLNAGQFIQAFNYNVRAVSA